MAKHNKKKQKDHNLEEKKVTENIKKDFQYIGEGSSFSDKLYNSLKWLNSGVKRKFLPKFMKSFIHRKVNHLLQLNILDEYKQHDLSDPLNNLHVPENEKVSIPTIWSIELFPPSELSLLQQALKKNGWDENDTFLSQSSHNDTLKKSRSAKGYRWWKLTTIHGYDSNLIIPDGVRGNIPSEFKFIELRGIQVGSSLTAVIAMVNLKEEVSIELNKAWHTRYEPELTPGKNWPWPINRKEVALRKIQSKRNEPYTLIRDWMTNNLPGFFATNDEKQPLLDLILLEELDPTNINECTDPTSLRTNREAYDALGLDIKEFQHLSSPSLPKLLLSEAISNFHEKDDNIHLWTLWGKRDEISDVLKRDEFYKVISNGNNDVYSISSYIDRQIETYFLLLSISSFLETSEKIYAISRDNANSEHIEFRPQSLKRLRNRLFTLSLNITTIKEDVLQFWSRINESNRLIKFNLKPTGYYSIQSHDSNEIEEERDFNEILKNSQERAFEDLIIADKNYRDILTTITSLGVSEDSSRLGRRALLVSTLSLIVAGSTFLFSEIRDGSILDRLLEYIFSLF